MSNVTVSLSMSLDGFVAGPNDEIDPLHDWLFGGEAESRHGHGLKLSETSREVIDEALGATGASGCSSTSARSGSTSSARGWWRRPRG